VIGVFSYLLQRTFRNRLARRLARLREPRYLVPFLVSLLWFGTWVFRPLLLGSRGNMRFGPGALSPELREGLVYIGGLAVFAWTALMWILPSKKAALAFSPAELHFLFPAPITRRQLVEYKLMQAQIGILFGALVSSFFMGARLMHPDGWGRVFALWLFFAIGHLHGIGASFVRTDLIEAGWSGLKRRLLSIAVILVVLAAVFASARDAWTALAQAASSSLGPDAESTFRNFGGVTHALATAGRSGIAGVVLWPFLALPRLLLAGSLDEFVRSAGAGVGILLLHYAWVVRSDTSFEEASLELSQKVAARRAARLETSKRGGSLVKRAGRFPWTLSPRGRPEVALVWKNLVNLSRVTPFRALFALLAFLFATITWTIQAAHGREGLWLLVAMLCAQVAAFTSVFGPVFLRNDLREDLFRIDSIRTMPLAGHQVVWAEILGSWCVLAAIQWALVGLGAIAYAMAGAPAVWKVPAPWLFAAAGASLLVLPGLSLVAVALQNALVVVFPAWVQLGNSRTRGFEASGQRILTLFGTLITLGVVAIPAAASGGVAAWLLSPVIGPACLLVGAVIAAGWMVAEVAFGCRFLGRLLDRLDPSTAGIEAQEE
jgi:ABC-2 type transport system permease protein